MKAIIYENYGPPEVARLVEREKPTPQANQVLVKVYSSTVNRTDSGFRSAEYVISRFWSGLFRPKYQVLGSEFAGEIESIGSMVTRFKVGDRVFGFNDKTFGGHAEYMIISEDQAMAILPDHLSYDVGACITEGGHYALCDIRAAKIVAGQHALVYGATGAIGSAAVQLLKSMGVRVTAVCNTKNVDLIKRLGADRVVDYQTQDFTQTEERYHLIFDAVGKSSFSVCKKLLTERGIYVSTELGKRGANVYLALLTPLFSKKRVLFPIPTINADDVHYLLDLVTTGKFTPIIDRSYRMEEIVEAYHYVQSGQKTGNVVLKIKG